MKKLLYLSIATFFVIACTNNSVNNESTSNADSAANDITVDAEAPQVEYDHKVGMGKYNEENFKVSATVDQELAKKGSVIYSAKCQSCHKITNEQLVGPGFKGVTERRTPVWIMNFLTNTDEMIDLDPGLQEQLEVCMVRMPDQALTEIDAHSMVEFFRNNDANR